MDEMEQLNLNSFDYKQLIGHCSLLVGASGSGKSRIIKEILFRLREDVPSAVVLCPTALQNKDFDGIIPNQAIITNLSGGRIVQKLSRLFKRQEDIVLLYNQANDLSYLKEISAKLEIQDETIEGLHNLLREYTKTRDQLLSQEPIPYDVDDTLEKIKKEETRTQKKLLEAYKKTIQSECSRRKQIGEPIPLSQQQRRLTKHLRINPNLLLILDDCASFFDHTVQKSEVFKKIAFQGRHVQISTIIAVQNDKTLIPEIRTQAHYLAFLDSASLEQFAKANAVFNTKVARQISETLRTYKEDYVKALYEKAQDRFHYVKAVTRQSFRFGSDTFWQFCLFMSKQKNRTT